MGILADKEEEGKGEPHIKQDSLSIRQNPSEIPLRFSLRGVRLVDATTDITDGEITIEGSTIEATGQINNTGDTEANEIIYLPGMIVTPGFIDVHTHGGGGCSLHTTDLQELKSYARWVSQTGVTSFLIGVVGVPGSIPEMQLRNAVRAMISQEKGEAEPLGINLEGPYISSLRRGAHLPSWLRTPDLLEAERLLELTNGCLRLITIAPELPGAPAMIRRLADAGVTISIGHTDSTYEQTMEALHLGITHATHCFNAMRPLQHRSPGPIGAITQSTQVRGELIADGVHVHPAMMNVLLKLLGPERIVVITDALSAAGNANASFQFAGQAAHVSHGAARLSDGTLTGSILTMDQALRNMLKMTEVSLQDAVRMQTLNPAQAINVAHRKGRLCKGYDADLLVFDASLKLQATICRGVVTFATDFCRQSLPIGLKLLA